MLAESIYQETCNKQFTRTFTLLSIDDIVVFDISFYSHGIGEWI